MAEKMMALAVIVVILLAIGVGSITNWYGLGTASTAGTGTGTGTGGSGTIKVESCPDSITVNYNDQDVQDSRNDPAGKINFISPDRGNVSDDGTITLGTQQAFKGIAGYRGTTYYAAVEEGNTDCKDQLDLQPKLAKSSALTITVVNDDGITKNTETGNQTLDASDKRDIEICYDSATNQYWGAPQADGKSMVVFYYNKTDIKTVYVDGYTPAAIPAIYSTLAADLGSYTGTVAYYVPNLVNGEKKCFTAQVQSTVSSTVSDKITGMFLDANLDKNEQTSEIIFGQQDEDQNNLTLKPKSFKIWYD